MGNEKLCTVLLLLSTRPLRPEMTPGAENKRTDNLKRREQNLKP